VINQLRENPSEIIHPNSKKRQPSARIHAPTPMYILNWSRTRRYIMRNPRKRKEMKLKGHYGKKTKAPTEKSTLNLSLPFGLRGKSKEAKSMSGLLGNKIIEKFL